LDFTHVPEVIDHPCRSRTHAAFSGKGRTHNEAGNYLVETCRVNPSEFAAPYLVGH